MNILILINHKFPYKKGETFLENEIGILSKAFDKVLMIPIKVENGEQITRSISGNNVNVHIINRGAQISEYIKDKCLAVRLFFCTFGDKGTIIAKIHICCYEAHAIRIAKKIIPILDTYDFREDDHIVLYSYWFYFPARIIVELKKYFIERKTKVTVISRAHRFDVYEERSSFGFLPQRELLLKEFDRVFACSQDGADYLKKKYPAFLSKIDTSLLGTYDHGTSDCCLRPFRIVSCSRLVEAKRVDLIAKAILNLIRKGLDIEWIHLGDGPEMNKIKGITGDNNRILFKGFLPNQQIYEFYKNTAVDLFVNVSSSEGLPVSIMEAISFGIPVVATDVGGTKEIVQNGVTGFLLPGNINEDFLSCQIERVIAMPPAEYKVLRNKARLFWEKRFNAIDNYSGFIQKTKSV